MLQNARYVDHLTNPDADRIKQVRRLAGRSVRKKTGRFLAEGPQAVRSALAHGTVREVYLTEECAARHSDCVPDQGHSARWWTCTTQVVQQLADAVTPQGVLAVCDLPEPPTTPLADQNGFAVALCDVQDPGNVGTIIRAADAAGAGVVFTTTGTADPFGPKSVRASVGSVFHLPVVTGCAVETILALGKEHGFCTLATAGAGTHALPELAQAARSGDGLLAQPHIWLFGNEAAGLAEPVLNQTSGTVRIPLFGHAESLNVAMAATICTYTSATAHTGSGI